MAPASEISLPVALAMIATACLFAAPVIWNAPHCRLIPAHQTYLELTAKVCARVNAPRERS